MKIGVVTGSVWALSLIHIYPDGIMASLLEGLTYGAGDAVLGLNPVDDSVESVTRVLERFEEIKTKWSIPTQTCVLAHVTTQMAAIRKGAPEDLIFQSIAGSQKGNCLLYTSRCV